MNMHMKELKKGFKKEMIWRVNNNREHIATSKKHGHERPYSNKQEYINQKTTQWAEYIQEQLQNGQIKTLYDLLQYYIRRNPDRTEETEGST